MTMKPFFINSNICTENKNVSTFSDFMSTVSGNVGNSYITYSLIKILFGGLININHIPNIYEYDFQNSDLNIDFINNEATHVFLILQDQIRKKESYGLKLPYKQIIDFVMKLNKPLIIAGLGANSLTGYENDFYKYLDNDLIDFLKFISDHCIEIGIRGNYTKEILHNIGIGNTRVIGCPSFFEMGRNRVIKKQEIDNIKSVLFTNRIYPISCSNSTILQDYNERNIIKSIAFGNFEDNLDLSNFDIFYNKSANIFSSINDWKNYVKNFKFAIGHRLHGSILAINSGVPVLCMNSDSRAREMCEFLNIPYNPNLNITSKSKIFDIYKELDISNLNSNYKGLYDNYVEFLHKNNLMLYEENISKYDYIEQPSLKLYTDEFDTGFKNLTDKFNKKLSKKSFFEKLFSISKVKSNTILIYILGIKISLKFKRNIWV